MIAARRARWRIWVHALDRTGPPMLARSVARWLRANRPDLALEVLAFRGGPLEREVADLAPVTVVLDDEEPWDADDVDPARAGELRRRLATMGAADVNLLVSVAAGLALPLAPHDVGPVVTWAVEVGEDLRWVDGSLGLRERTDRWLAGSEATAAELSERLGEPPCPVVPEVVDPPQPVAPEVVSSVRRAAGVADGERMVLGAGIGTHRKGLDLFVEVAVAHRREAQPRARFVWVGGTRDELHPLVAADVERFGIDHVVLAPAVPDLDPWCAAADVFLHTARLDAFPLVCLHAAAAGTPVVAFLDRTGVAEMFGDDAIGAPYPDVAGLATAVAALADPGAARAAGRRQRDRVAERHLAPSGLRALHDAVDAAASPPGGAA